MKTIIATAAVLLIGAASIAAQTPPPPAQKATPPPNEPVALTVVQCGKPEVRSASQLVRDGAPVKFTVTLNGNAKDVIYSWSISSGIITGGQGTPTIDVDTSGAGADKQITASVLLGGLPPECAYEASTSIRVAAPAKKVDEYATLKEDEELAKLTGLVETVTPGSEQAFIFVYAGRNSQRGQGDLEVRRIRASLQKSAIGPDRVVVVNGGFREEVAHELWIVPIGAEPPRATPTINAKDIVYAKPTPPVVKKPGV